MTIERLDYSQPPPGYVAGHDDMTIAVPCAWAHYKRHNDPPGMSSGRLGGVLNSDLGRSDYNPRTERWIWVGLTARSTGRSGVGSACAWPTMAEARAAAWTWHDHRLALAGRHNRCNLADSWPRALTWSDEQVAEVERWLVDSTAEMPEVLRG